MIRTFASALVAGALLLGCGAPTASPPLRRAPVAVAGATATPSSKLASSAPRDERLVMRTQPQRLIHGARVRYVAASSSVIVAADQNRMLRFWDRKTGRQLSATMLDDSVDALLPVPGTDTFVAAVSSHLFTFGFDGRKRRSDELAPLGFIRWLVVNATGTRLAVSSYSEVKVLDIASLETVAKSDEFQGIKALAFAGETIVVATSDKVVLWDPKGGTRELVGGTGARSAVAATIDGRRIAACVGDEVVVWTADGKLSWTHGAKYCRELAFSPNDEEIAAEISPGKIGRWDASSGTLVGTLQGEVESSGAVTALAYTQDGALVSGGEDHTVREFDLATGDERHPHGGNQGDVLSVVASETLGTVFTAARDSDVMAWPLRGGAEPGRIPPSYRWGGRCVALHGKRLVVASHSVELWHASSRKRIRVLSEDHGGCDGLVVSPDGKRVAYADTGELFVFDVSDANAPAKSWMPPSEVRGMRFSPDGKLLAVGDDENRIVFLDVATTQPAFTIDTGASVIHATSSSDGKLAAAALAENVLKVWRVDLAARSASELMRLENPEDLIWRTTFIPGKPWLAFGTTRGRVRVWNYEANEEVDSFEAHFGFIFTMWANEKWLATGGGDHTAALWDIKRFGKR